MKENKLIKFESNALQKVGNAIAITDKLLQNNLDYLKWWNDLDDSWKRYFIFQIKKIADSNRKKITKVEDYNQIELMVSIFDENYSFIKGNYDLDIEIIKYLLSFKKLDIFTVKQRDPEPLEPLKLFSDLEKLEIRGVTINSLKSLEKLKKLKLFDCSKAIISKVEIEQFKKAHPNCAVIV